MIKKILKNKFILILIIIVLVLIIIKIISKKTVDQPSQPDILIPDTSSQNKTTTTPITTPKIISTNIVNSNLYPTLKPKEETISDINYEIPLSQFLPYQGKYFVATRYIEANNIETKVYNRKDTDLAKKEIQEWLAKYGVENIDKFTIIY